MSTLEALSDVARARNEGRDAGGAAMNDLSMRASKLRGYVCARRPTCAPARSRPRAYLEESLDAHRRARHRHRRLRHAEQGRRQQGRRRLDRRAGAPASRCRRSTACRSPSRTSSRPPTCRPARARRSGRAQTRTAIRRPSMRCARPAPSSSARPPPPNSPPAIRGTRPRTRTIGKRTPGGSSSGSAAAVGAGMVPAGLGTQVVGSILRPSSFCGASASSRASAASTAAARTIISARAARARSARRSPTPGRWLRAIADRAGGDPGFVGLTGDVDFSKRAKPARLGIAGDRRLERHQRRRAQGVRRREAASSPTAGIELHGRADDPDIEAVEKAIADALAADASRSTPGRAAGRSTPTPTSTPSKLSAGARDRLKTAEAMTQKQVRRAAGAARGGRARPTPRRRAATTPS